MISISTYTLIRYINSCKTPEHLQVANKLVDNYKKLFSGCYGYEAHTTRIQMALQLARINVILLAESI